MALPIEFITERAEYLDEEFNKCQIHELENLTKDDFSLLGMYIQTFCFVDLNIQRVFYPLKNKNIIKTTSNDKISIPSMITELINSIDVIAINSLERNYFVDMLNEIKSRRDYRNLFAHWAAKRIPNEDAMVFITSDHQDYRKVHNSKIAPGVIAYAIFDIADLRGLINHLKKHEEWIAHFTAEIFNAHELDNNSLD
ncbi:hypothetical protein L8P89_07680 [Enterobacter roggenkampii]|uniref:hypothetical protein n=1 Tax=Enterobacter roggenkampii TaxID=1812935 RepID=UPI00200313CF|nr:hypothetical protein [Enterobacter roggenkampii]MCK7075160.1 hypothetical protein [Enterobacter roggenkampii]